ncbi:hypothetical protein HYV88_05020 [Candidatus Woesearchaeota archaeon]|nr:hypothetical protein [Candidatus Woesearchaeota archaeon]
MEEDTDLQGRIEKEPIILDYAPIAKNPRLKQFLIGSVIGIILTGATCYGIKQLKDYTDSQVGASLEFCF